MPKKTEAAHHEEQGFRLIVTSDDTDPERPIEVKKVDLDPAERARLMRLREEGKRKQ